MAEGRTRAHDPVRAQGHIVALCISDRKGVQKRTVERARLVEGHGLEGDAHAGPWHRQLSLLEARDIDGMRARGLELAPGAFGENVVVEGLDLGRLGPGTRLELGAGEIELTQIGKVCHTRCAIYQAAGDCIMPRVGLFARVLKGADLAPGDRVEVAEEISRDTVQAAVLTVSDRCARGQAIDTAGPAVEAELERAAGARIAWRDVVPDDPRALEGVLRDWVARRVDLILTAGGTGCGPRDNTPEATRRVIAREVPGLAEAMRAASLRVTPHAMLQRGVSGIAGETLIVNLPGSEKAAVENLRVILPALAHAVRLLRGDTAHPESDRDRQPGPCRPLPFDGGNATCS